MDATVTTVKHRQLINVEPSDVFAQHIPAIRPPVVAAAGCTVSVMTSFKDRGILLLCQTKDLCFSCLYAVPCLGPRSISIVLGGKDRGCREPERDCKRQM